jgi:hypothetical protein
VCRRTSAGSRAALRHWRKADHCAASALMKTQCNVLCRPHFLTPLSTKVGCDQTPPETAGLSPLNSWNLGRYQQVQRPHFRARKRPGPGTFPGSDLYWRIVRRDEWRSAQCGGHCALRYPGGTEQIWGNCPPYSLINREFTGKIGLKRAGDARRASIHTEFSVGYPKIPATGNREFIAPEQRTSNGNR